MLREVLHVIAQWHLVTVEFTAKEIRETVVNVSFVVRFGDQFAKYCRKKISLIPIAAHWRKIIQLCF